MQKQLTTLLEKEMDRKEFLQIIGLGLASVAGLGALGNAFFSSKVAEKSVGSYGSSVYGGSGAARQTPKP